MFMDELFGRVFTKKLTDFPISFADLTSRYQSFNPHFEHHRSSFEQFFAPLLKNNNLSEVEKILNSDDALSQELLQRHFYMSSTSFYRSFQLFLAYLTLDKNRYNTWAEVTGYYSRFYFIQAFINLLQSTLIYMPNKLDVKNNKERNFIIYNTGNRIRLLNLNKTGGFEKIRGSHQRWWHLFHELESLTDYPVEEIDFILSDYYFNPDKRNEVNYSHDYLKGFIELEWFDIALDNMMAHYNVCSQERQDRDITNIDRFFEGCDPEYCDPADFYADDAQILWYSIKIYLLLIKTLNINQDFITFEKLESISRIHLHSTLPTIFEGIINSCREILEEPSEN